MAKRIALLCMALIATFFAVYAANCESKGKAPNISPVEQSKPVGAKVLVVYFSATGNTKQVAEKIASLSGADLAEIIPEKPYTADDLNYRNENSRANLEQRDQAVRPKMSQNIPNIDKYDVILIGHPIWWGEEPRIIDTFLESYDFSGKTVVSSATSGGSDIGKASKNLQALAPKAHWLPGERFETGASKEEISLWLTDLRLGI